VDIFLSGETASLGEVASSSERDESHEESRLGSVVGVCESPTATEPESLLTLADKLTRALSCNTNSGCIFVAALDTNYSAGNDGSTVR
jgi:hypothetical protein